MKRIFVFISAIVFASCGAENDAEPIMEMPPPMETPIPPAELTVLRMANFTGYAHSLSGKAVVYERTSGGRIVSLENFTMTSGPDVFILFSRSNVYSKANTVAVSMIRGSYQNATVQYELPDDIDLTTHPFVLVYCVRFSQIFGVAEVR